MVELFILKNVVAFAYCKNTTKLSHPVAIIVRAYITFCNENISHSRVTTVVRRTCFQVFKTRRAFLRNIKVSVSSILLYLIAVIAHRYKVADSHSRAVSYEVSIFKRLGAIANQELFGRHVFNTNTTVVFCALDFYVVNNRSRNNDAFWPFKVFTDGALVATNHLNLWVGNKHCQLIFIESLVFLGLNIDNFIPVKLDNTHL